MPFYASMPQHILTTAEMAAVDAEAVRKGVSIDRLVEAAGRAVADVVCRSAPRFAKIDVVCGPGNNGGDGYVAARVLSERGYNVNVFAAGSPRSSAAARAATRWIGPVRSLDLFRPDANGVVIDALYGAGLSGPLTGEDAAAVAQIEHSGATVVAVDVPSGLNGDTGQPMGPTVCAHQTISFFSLKPAHLLWPGRGLCGEITIADIGLTPDHAGAVIVPQLFHNGPALWREKLRRPPVTSHKYQHGHCLVVSGPEFQTGASRLAGVAAMNNGIGAVTIAGEASALRIHAAHVTAIMLREAPTSDAFAKLIAERRFDAVVIGPAAGVGLPTLSRILAAARQSLPMVIDADGLSSLIGHLDAFVAARAIDSPCVMTPHAGEFARLFSPMLATDIAFFALSEVLRASKVEQARAAARIANAVVVYKGSDTVIAAPDGRAAINSNGGPELATAGSGDVLSGLIGAHLASGMPAFEAAAAAVWQHGAIGSQIGVGLTADKLAAKVMPLSALV